MLLSPKMDCMGACTLSRLVEKSEGNMLARDGLEGEFNPCGSGDVIDLAELVSIGLLRGLAPIKAEALGDGLLTGEAVPPLGLGEPSRRIIVDEIVFLAACLARSVLTKLVTSSSKLPLRFGEASNSKGPTSVDDGVCGGEVVMWVMLEPLAGDSLLDDGGDENDEFLDNEAEFLPGCWLLNPPPE